MCLVCSVAYGGTAAMALISGSSSVMPVDTRLASQSTIGQLTSLQSLPAAVETVQAPQIKEPQWLVEQKTTERAAAEAAQRRTITVPGQKITVTYDVTTRGAITADVAEFKRLANATLNDGRGWSRMGVYFQEVTSGGQFTLILAAANEVANASPGCSAEYSCNVGRLVLINQDRWLGATSSWNAGGGSLRDYQHMVVNHETGHWLGHGHSNCSGAGQPAAVMQQQSIDLQGCSFNPWPLDSELSSRRLGI